MRMYKMAASLNKVILWEKEIPATMEPYGMNTVPTLILVNTRLLEM